MELCKSACTIASNSRQLKVMNIVKAKNISNTSNYFQNGNGLMRYQVKGKIAPIKSNIGKYISQARTSNDDASWL